MKLSRLRNRRKKQFLRDLRDTNIYIMEVSKEEGKRKGKEIIWENKGKKKNVNVMKYMSLHMQNAQLKKP